MEVFVVLAIVAAAFLWGTKQGRAVRQKLVARVAGARTVYNLAVASDDSKASAVKQAVSHLLGL